MPNRRLTVTRVRLGVIGPTDLVDRTVMLGAAFPALDLIARPYTDEREAPALFRAVLADAEAVLFTGPVPYRLAVAEAEPSVPTMFVHLKGTGLYRTLYHARESTDLTRVSIDTLSRSDVEETYGELGLPSHQVLCSGPKVGRQELVQFHTEAYRAGRTSAALTCLHSAALELSEAGVPNYWVTPTTADLKGALDRALLLGANNRQGHAVLGIITVAPGDDLATEHQFVRMRHEIFGLLLRFVEQFDGHLLAPGANEYQFFATREPFERSTGALSQTEILEELRRVSGGRASMGVGMGRTANEAGTHARIALRRAMEDAGSACYIVLENRRLVGPLGRGPAVVSNLRSLDENLLAVARAAGMSGPGLERLFSALDAVETFTASDVAERMEISLRSAHRLVANLEKAGGIEPAGQEKLVTAGRPRTVYRVVRRAP